MVKKSNYLKNFDGTNLLTALEAYSSEVINIQPLTEKQLYDMYEVYTDPILTHIRNMEDDMVFVLTNEARDMFGHIADYRLDTSKRKNLADAYGHFRRLNLDAFKIICDKLDGFLYLYLRKHNRYDYREERKNFLLNYSKDYFEAKKVYLNAQVSEHAGSDRVAGNIIHEYYRASKMYVRLFVFLQNKHAALESIKRKTIVKLSFDAVIAISGIVLSLLT